MNNVSSNHMQNIPNEIEGKASIHGDKFMVKETIYSNGINSISILDNDSGEKIGGTLKKNEEFVEYRNTHGNNKGKKIPFIRIDGKKLVPLLLWIKDYLKPRMLQENEIKLDSNYLNQKNASNLYNNLSGISPELLSLFDRDLLKTEIIPALQGEGEKGGSKAWGREIDRDIHGKWREQFIVIGKLLEQLVERNKKNPKYKEFEAEYKRLSDNFPDFNLDFNGKMSCLVVPKKESELYGKIQHITFNDGNNNTINGLTVTEDIKTTFFIKKNILPDFKNFEDESYMPLKGTSLLNFLEDLKYASRYFKQNGLYN